MALLRAFFLRHRALAFVLVAATLWMKMLVPAGMMVGQDARVLTVQICAESIGHVYAAQIAVPMKQGHGDASGKQAGADCPFSALTMAATGGADPVQLALALAFILLAAFAAAPALALRRAPFLRPPLRGPPALA